MCYQKCNLCSMQVSTAGKPSHEASKTCQEMAAGRRQHAVAAQRKAALRQTFTAYGEPLRQVSQFKYLGRIVSYEDSDVPAVRRQIKRARRTWGQFCRLLEKEEVPPRVAGMFYQAVVASILLYGSESWVLPPSALWALEGFHVEAARRLTGMRAKKVEGEWVYPHSEDVLAASHLQPISHYIGKRCYTVS